MFHGPTGRFRLLEGRLLRPEESFLQPLSICNVGMHTIGFTPLQGTLTSRLYGNREMIYEESHCQYGINRSMIDLFASEGMIVSGYDDEDEPKIMEYDKNSFFVIALFLPQLNTSLDGLHPLFFAFFNSILVR